MRFRLDYLLLASLVLFGFTVLVARADDDRDAFRKLHQELRQRMDDDLDEATQYLESQIATDPDSADLNVLRHSLATKLAEAREHKSASEQFKRLLEFQIKHIDDSENQFGIWMTIQSWQDIDESNSDLADGIASGLQALTSVKHAPGTHVDALPLDPIAQLTVLRAQHLASDDQADDAKDLIDQQLKALGEINQSDRATVTSAQTLIRMLQSLTSADRSNDDWRDEMIKQLEQTVTDSFERFPDSQLIQNDYAATQLMMITRWGQDDPDATKTRIEKVTETLSPLAIKNASVSATLRRISLHNEKMASVKPVAKLVGNPAPDWDIDAWVNVIEMDRKDLDGKVVLLDFWAMWCGPCVATFHHLREWREEFGDDGFEIVGVTGYYNYQWDAENKRASRAKEEVSPEQERQTIASFLKHHQLKHPVIVNPEDSEMGSQYGARGIPHVVLIDREGIVQLVRTGAGEATAKEIHAKIKELMEDHQ